MAVMHILSRTNMRTIMDMEVAEGHVRILSISTLRLEGSDVLVAPIK